MRLIFIILLLPLFVRAEPAPNKPLLTTEDTQEIKKAVEQVDSEEMKNAMRLFATGFTLTKARTTDNKKQVPPKT